MAKKKKIIELVHERVARVIGTNLSDRNTMTALNEVAVSLLTYSARITAWTETELTKLDQMIVKLLKKKGLLHRFCNKSRLYRSRKAFSLGLQSMLLGNWKQLSKLHARLAAMTSNKRAVIEKLGEQLKTPLSNVFLSSSKCSETKQATRLRLSCKRSKPSTRVKTTKRSNQRCSSASIWTTSLSKLWTKRHLPRGFGKSTPC